MERERKMQVTGKTLSQKKATMRVQLYTSEVLYIKFQSHWIGVLYR